MVAVTPQTGAVRAMVGGPGFDRYRYNLATQGARQPGSSFKIFVLTAALEAGLVPDDIVNGTGPCSFANPGGYPDPYVANNFADGGGSTATITSNTTASSNCAFLRLGKFIGLQRVVDIARRMGITTELDARNLSLPIGSEEVHPIDMAGAAAILANEGIRHRPYFIDRVTDRDGNVLYQHESPGRQVVSRQSACLATGVLEANVQGGTGTAAALPNMAGRGQDGHGPELRRRLVRGLHALPGHGRVDGQPRRPRPDVQRGRARGHRRLLSRGDLARVQRARPRGPGVHRLPDLCPDPARAQPGPLLRSDPEETPRRPTPTRASPDGRPVPPATCPADLNGDGVRRELRRRAAPRHLSDPAVAPRPTEADGEAEVELSPLERLLAVQDEDTMSDQLLHRRSHLPERQAVDDHAAVGGGASKPSGRHGRSAGTSWPATSSASRTRSPRWRPGSPR